MNKLDKEETIEYILQEIQKQISKRKLKQSDILELCKEKGYMISQSELSRILSRKTSLGLYPAIALADVLGLNLNELLYPERKQASGWKLSPDVFAVHPKDKDIKNYLGTYTTIFHSTDVQETDKFLFGRLVLYAQDGENGIPYCAALFSLDTGETDSKGEPILKKYYGQFLVSRRLNVAYCLLFNNQWGEVSVIEFRHRSFLFRKVACRLGLVLTVSAGERKIPVAHKFLMYREEQKLNPKQEKLLLNMLKMTGKEVYIEEDVLKMSHTAEVYPTIKEVIDRIPAVPYYVLSPAVLKGIDRKLSDVQLNELFSALKADAESPYSLYIEETDDNAVYETIFTENETISSTSIST